MSTTLSIAFTGLCAILGNGNGQPGEVLLLDGKGIGQVAGVTIPQHAPTLVIGLRHLVNPEGSRPTRVIVGPPGATSEVEQLGVWDLAGTEVRIRAQGEAGTGLQFFRPSPDATPWSGSPRDLNDPGSWRDLRFVPSMKDLVGDGRIAPSLIDGEDAGMLPASVATRIHLDSGLLEAAMPSQESFRRKVFEFQANGSDQPVRQALTDTVRWTLKTEAVAIVIDITPVGGGETKRLLLSPSRTAHRAYVSNLPAENPSHTHQALSEAELGAIHFGAYYTLLMNEPVRKPVPSAPATTDIRKGTGFVDGGFCPPALFTLP
jgi:hypothetical protein